MTISLVRGVPESSILGRLFFKLFITDLILFVGKTNICNFGNGHAIYSCNIDLQTILKDLKYDMQKIIKML